MSEATVAGILDDYEKAFATFRADPSADGRVRLRSTLIEIAGRMEVEARN